ncbi:sodium/proton antiporter NhaB [Gynuella sunshinyii]|uniref:Na(+)/H(+) antiporter NhaB n=1 Tax=Gynuella sunshinyii YC6258 TaxID=1445510 RepID=A0A0C5VYE2_9GAMM|nr:sodium/proton antiporter NhaB [Gynuella sunshinyii]AJQ95409.1 Na+/H+ antiporter [Gynuella sunshinyii YC6258]
MVATFSKALTHNFLGNAPQWYKQVIIAFLIINPILLFILGDTGPTVVGWLLIGEFIFTLAMALKCYPLLPGGLLAIEAVIIGLAGTGVNEEGNFVGPANVMMETEHNLEVILLLMFMVAGIYFMKDLLLFAFTKVFLKVRSKALLSLLFSIMAAILSAFLDALTVTAVLISISVGFYSVYHRVASGKHFTHEHNHDDDDQLGEHHRDDLENFRGFLRSLLMHGAVGTALGGVCTLVGEPQNLLIANVAGWDFVEFFIRIAPVSMPVLVAGLLTCLLLEKMKWFGYGDLLPDSVRGILEDFDRHEQSNRTRADVIQLMMQGGVAAYLVLALAFHLAEVGLIGLSVIILLTALNGINDEHAIGKAFTEALPFTALLIVFFAIVAVIHAQHLFTPIISWVLTLDTEIQPVMFFMANGVLSMISDNVFVATVYINEVYEQLQHGHISREHFDVLTVAINTGTNLPSVATPNGQAAFLFLLTSAIAPLIRLSYGRMVWMALPYTVVLTGVSIVAVLVWF